MAMRDTEFYIYSDRNELRMPATTSFTEYRVERLLKPKELKPFIKAFKEELEMDGLQSIHKNFDKLFSVIEFIDQIDYLHLHIFYEQILVRSLNIINSFLSSSGDIEDIALDIRHQLRNIIKMSVYLFIEFFLSFNQKIETDYKLILLETKGRNRKQDMIQKHTSEYDWDWEDKLGDGIKAINSIIMNNITQLYDPPYVDHTLISYIASCCYIQLENPSIAYVRTKRLRDIIMQLMVVLITDYSHAQGFKTKVVKLLKSFEHLSILFAKIVIQVVESKDSRSSLVELIVKEIAETGKVEGIKESNNHEVTGGKSCCAFLVEIAKHCPKIVLPSIELLLPCLESDPYTMRICVLSVLKEIIINVLSIDDLDELGKNTRDKYLSILQDHLLDTNAFVRSKTLQLFITLTNENCLPKYKFITILNCANEKLHDKSSYVTKSAVQLIKTLIKSNPYSCDFTENKLQEKLEEENVLLNNLKQILEEKLIGTLTDDEMWSSIEPPLKLFLAENIEDNCLQLLDEPNIEEHILKNIELPTVLNEIKCLITQRKFELASKFLLHGRETFKNEPLFKVQDEENLSEQFFTLFKNIWWSEKTSTKKSMNNPDIENLTADELNVKIVSAKSRIKYLQECAEYSNTIKSALVTINQLMFRSTTSESLEAIDFFATAHLFGVPNTQIGIDSMLVLTYSSDANIKEATMNTYKKIYLNIEENNDSTAIKATMSKILNLVKSLDVTYRNAFKILLDEWIKNKTLNDDCIMILWAWFTKTENISQEDRIVTTFLISLLASVKPCIAKANLDSLIKYGLCDDYKIFIYTCQVLEQISDENLDRLNENHDIVNRVLNVTIKCYKESDNQIFNYVASNAVNIIYKLTLKPDITCMMLIEKCFKLIQIKKKNSSVHEEKCMTLDIDLYAKFIFIIGHIALQQNNYLENYVSKELIQSVLTKYEAKKLKTNQSNEDELMHDSKSIEIEAINNRIRNACDRHLVTGKGVLSKFSKHVINACESNNLQLKASASITLVKFMMVSTSFCRTNLPLYLNLLENSDDSVNSIDLIAGFGWLVFKHPNLLEPFTDKLFEKLKDKDDEVRYSALITIVDLIRQEMIKVRSQIAGVAKLLVDENLKIKCTAKQLFGIIAEKGNTLYNVLSDIISILSNPEDMIIENDFQEIMKFLLPFVNKERQIESIVDKLCIRLKESNNDVQEYYISYCLLNLKYTDKSLTKLSDNMSYYSEKLKNPKVYNNFNILISTNSRLAKPTTKEILSDLTKNIEKIVEYEDFVIPLSQKTPRKRPNTEKKRPFRRTIKKCTGKEIEPLQTATRVSSRCQLKVKKKLLNVGDGEESNADCETDDV